MAFLGDEELGDKQLRTVIVRLVLDRWGALLYGEVVDTEGRARSRAHDWQGILAAIQAFVAPNRGT